MSDKIVYFNINGTIFTFHIDRLERTMPDGLLTKLSNSSIPAEKDKDGNIFLDLDPHIFGIIYQYILLDTNSIDICECKTMHGLMISDINVTYTERGIDYLRDVVKDSKSLGIGIQKMMSFLCIEVPTFKYKNHYYKWSKELAVKEIIRKR